MSVKTMSDASPGNTVHAVLFDADGVLQTTSAGWRSKLGSLCGNPAALEDFLTDVFAAEKPCTTGDGDFEQALSEVLARWGSTVSVAEALQVWQLIEPADELLLIVRSLRERGVRVGLASNQQAIRARFMAEDLGYASCFDDLFFSCRIGHAKPSSEYFLRVLDLLALDAGQVLFIDDHATNVTAARGCGLQAEVFKLTSGPAAMRALLDGFNLSTGHCRA